MPSFASPRVRRAATLAALCLLLPWSRARAQADVTIDSDTFGGLTARSIGPAAMGGRIAALDAVRLESGKLLIFVGSASGGVWRSKDGGVTFAAVFDEQKVQSIGAVTIDPSDPKTIWVGTGESWVRNSVSIGDGVYKSTDGGDTWTRMGLENTERIARIVVDPTNANVVYVAATGHCWNANPERGVYKTTDGGKTWARVLYVDANTGASDVAIDPAHPNTLYAGMWQYRRLAWGFTSGGPGSGLYKTTDGGATWTRLTAGLPAGELGRIAVAVAPSLTRTVYATVEAKKTALYRSDDSGGTWTELSSSGVVSSRPFYFSALRVDPRDDKRVYKMSTSAGVSDDGGRTFLNFATSVHSDHHALWIEPANPQHLLIGSDGGVYETWDRGGHWRFLDVLPVSQFYHVSADMRHPYNVYGGLQDNGSWMGPSTHPDGIGNRHWRVLGGGDGFWAFPDPTDDDITFVEYQGGHLLRVRKSTGETKEIPPFERAGESLLRFNWNTPVHMSASSPGTMYVGAQFLFRSRDRGDSWERISPDLTTNDPKKLQQLQSGGLTVDNSTAENHCTIYAISESPRRGGVIWVGTDDGNVQVTRDAGATWTNVTRAIAGLPKNAWVSSINASAHDDGTAYVTFDNHTAGDMHPYVYVTADYGRTWRALATPDIRGYAHVVRDDPVNPDLLFAGTECGLFLSVDRGAHWAQFTGNMPSVAVRDLVVHPRDGDLIVATHGRGIYILDDLTPLRAFSPSTALQDVAFLPTRPAVLRLPSGEQRFDGDAAFVGSALSDQAYVSYYLKKRHVVGELRLDVLDPTGALVTTIPGGKRKGINRVGVPTRRKAPKVPPATSLVPQQFAFLGPRLAEGSYTVRMTKGSETFTSQLTLAGDPRSTHTASDRALQYDTATRLYNMLERMTYVVDTMIDVSKQLTAHAKTLGADALAVRATALAAQVDAQRAAIVSTREGGMLAGEQQLRERLGALYGGVNGYDGRPTDSQVAYAQVLEDRLTAAEASFVAFLSKDLEAFNKRLAPKTLAPVVRQSLEEWRAREAKR